MRKVQRSRRICRVRLSPMQTKASLCHFWNIDTQRRMLKGWAAIVEIAIKAGIDDSGKGK